MSNGSIREGIQAFLNARRSTSSYLIGRYNTDLESQILVHPGSQCTEGSNNEWTDGEEVWKDHRWPHQADTQPSYHDKALTYSPGAHIKRIGTTWWNWVTKESHAIAMDIDLSGEHAESTTTVDVAKLDELIQMLKSLPYITMVRSTGGNGLHVYTFFDAEDRPTAENHNEHAQFAGAVLEKICEDTGYDFRRHIDVKGCILWIWGDDSPTSAFSVIKEATEELGAKDIEPFLAKAMRVNPAPAKFTGFTESGTEVEMTTEGSEHEICPLDEQHKEILKAIEDTKYAANWFPEYNMLHTHTCAIKEVAEKFADEGRPFVGLFETISRGNNPGHPNCYITPREGGGFKVARFGHGTSEHDLWLSNQGQTFCYINQKILPMTIMRKFASKTTQSSLTFEAEDLQRAMVALGKEFNCEGIEVPVRVTWDKEGVFTAKAKTATTADGWEREDKSIVRELPIVSKNSRRDVADPSLDFADSFIRFLLSPDMSIQGWAHKNRFGWTKNKSADLFAPIINTTFADEAQQVKCALLENPWMLVHEPFQPEYPGGRRWNKDAPQLLVAPASEAGPHKHWDMILANLGKSLDDAVEAAEWCQEWGIMCGADYLRYWLACLVQYPFEPLPYLFFYGPQGCGKSIFYQQLDFIFTKGVKDAKNALLSSNNFNGELVGAVLAYTEEVDLSKANAQVSAKIKDWTTAKNLLVHPKGLEPYLQPNTLHLIQLANSALYCPIEDGDTRIVVVQVEALENPIPRMKMFQELQREAPYFVRTLLNTAIPEPLDRLRLPVLTTEAKSDLESLSHSAWETFAREAMEPCFGATVSFREFHNKYMEYCSKIDQKPEAYRAVSRQMQGRSDMWTLGIYKNKQLYLGNTKWSDDTETKPGKKLVLNDKGRLRTQ